MQDHSRITAKADLISSNDSAALSPEPSNPARRGGGPDRTAIIKGVVLGAFLLVVVVLWVTLPVPTVEEIRDTVGMLGWWGGIGFIAGYGILSLIPVPKSVVSIAAGLIWGFGVAVLLVTLASALGATLAFVIGRALGKDLVEKLMGAHVRRVDDALAENGLRAVIVLRLIPVLPFTLVNYSAGLTRVTRRDYALGTLIGMLPGTVVFVAVGAYGFTLGLPFFLTLAAIALVALVVFLLVRRHRASRDSPSDDAAGAVGSA